MWQKLFETGISLEGSPQNANKPLKMMQTYFSLAAISGLLSEKSSQPETK